MELKEFLKAIKDSCSFLEQEGYALRKVDTSVNRNFWYEKDSDNEGFRISFGWTQYGDEFHIKGVQALKRFNDIENIFQKVKGGILQDFYTIYKSPKTEYIPENFPYTETENNIHFVLKNTSDVLLFANFLKEFFIKSVKSFFDFFHNLPSVNLWLNNSEVEHHKDLIVLWDNTMMARKLLIMKITKNENFISLYEKYKAFLSNKNEEKESPYVEMFTFFTKVDIYLSVQ